MLAVWLINDFPSVRMRIGRNDWISNYQSYRHFDRYIVVMKATEDSDLSMTRDALKDFREQTLDRMSLIAYPFIVPFGFWHLYLGGYAMGGLMLAIALTMGVRSYRGYTDKFDPVLNWLLSIELIVAMLLGYATVGIAATFWSYPLFFVIIFLCPRQHSGHAMILALSVLVPATFVFLETEIAARLGLTLILFSYMGYQLVGVLLKMQDRLETQAMRDPLTGAYNRRYLVKAMRQSTEEMRRDIGPVSLVALDIDNFKAINDTFGHEAGDKVLVNLVETLHAMRRSLDVVCRSGGEEFVILLRNTNEAGACAFADRLRQSVEQSVLLEGQVVTVSIGVAEYLSDETEDQWLRRADTFLYKAKHEGRNQVQPPPPPQLTMADVAFG